MLHSSRLGLLAPDTGWRRFTNGKSSEHGRFGSQSSGVADDYDAFQLFSCELCASLARTLAFQYGSGLHAGADLAGSYTRPHITVWTVASTTTIFPIRPGNDAC